MVGCYPIPRGCRKTSDGYALPTIFYMMGQALGSLGSWPAFALCHHLVIQFCAQRAYGTFGFKDYALLGDDVCIADDKMAKELYSLMCAKERSRINARLFPLRNDNDRSNRKGDLLSCCAGI